MKRLLILMVRAYKRGVSPWLPPACRFHPTCSAYAQQCLETQPLARALRLIALRLLRCQPFHPGGLDPVPPRLKPTSHG